jgi:heme oxygenase (biliverdin-IX-beta and delta-forming)
VRSGVAHQLKQHTASTHARVEDALGLLDPDLSAVQLRAVLGRFAGFWQGNERLIDEWAQREPGPAEALNWPRRRRLELLRSDLLRLGMTVRELTALPEAPAVFTGVDTADVLGWLYVSEGSTLGGAVIDRTLRTLPEIDALRVRTFTPYLEGPGPMWRSYLHVLEEWVGVDADRCARVITAAVGTFDALERWLVPVDTEDAA